MTYSQFWRYKPSTQNEISPVSKPMTNDVGKLHPVSVSPEMDPRSFISSSKFGTCNLTIEDRWTMGRRLEIC